METKTSIGDCVGLAVGLAVGDAVGDWVGLAVGAAASKRTFAQNEQTHLSGHTR
jgi:phage tail tape-measure protein